MLYLTFKWLHIVAVICWMAGILYLFRLFIYHKEQGIEDQGKGQMLLTMEERLYKYITSPAMIVTWFAGLFMIYLMPSLAKGGWFHTKFLFVIFLTGATHYAKGLYKKFLAKNYEKIPSSRALRVINEVPAVLMLIIVGMVVFKPF